MAACGTPNPLVEVRVLYTELVECEANSAVECLLAKQDATGSNPVPRSLRLLGSRLIGRFPDFDPGRDVK